MAEEKMHFASEWKDFCATSLFHFILQPPLPHSWQKINPHSWTPLSCVLYVILLNYQHLWITKAPVGSLTSLQVLQKRCPRSAMDRPGDTEAEVEDNLGKEDLPFWEAVSGFWSEDFLSLGWMSHWWCILCVLLGFLPPHSTDWNGKFSIVLLLLLIAPSRCLVVFIAQVHSTVHDCNCFNSLVKMPFIFSFLKEYKRMACNAAE